MKLRKNLLIALMTGLLALGGVACGGDDTGGDTETEGGTTDLGTEGGDVMTEEMATE